MSLVDPGVENSTDRDDTQTDTETIEIPVEEYEQLQTENEELHDEIEELHEKLDNKVDDDYRTDNERDKADIRRSLHSLKEAVKPAIGMAESHKIDGESGVQSEQPTTQYRESPIEQVCGFPEEMARKQLTQNEQRARYIALRIKSFASPAMREDGYRISSQKIRHILDEYDTSGHTETVKRVIDMLEDFARGETIRSKINDDGKRNVFFEGSLAERLSAIVPEQTDESTTPVVIASRG